MEEIFVKNSFEKFAFCKGETLHFFLSQKEKSFKKEVGNLSDASVRGRLDGLSGFIPQSPLVSVLSRLRESGKPARAQSFSLDERNFAARRFFEKF